jgi:hypothetical protein
MTANKSSSSCQCEKPGNPRGVQRRLPLGEFLLQQHIAVITERHQVKGRFAKVNPYRTNLHINDAPEPAHKILQTTVKFKRRTTSVTPYYGIFAC